MNDPIIAAHVVDGGVFLYRQSDTQPRQNLPTRYPVRDKRTAAEPVNPNAGIVQAYPQWRYTGTGHNPRP